MMTVTVGLMIRVPGIVLMVSVLYSAPSCPSSTYCLWSTNAARAVT